MHTHTHRPPSRTTALLVGSLPVPLIATFNNEAPSDLGPLLEDGISGETLKVNFTHLHMHIHVDAHTCNLPNEKKSLHNTQACLHTHAHPPPLHTHTYATQLQGQQLFSVTAYSSPRSHCRQWSSGWPWSTVGRWETAVKWEQTLHMCTCTHMHIHVDAHTWLLPNEKKVCTPANTRAPPPAHAHISHPPSKTTALLIDGLLVPLLATVDSEAPADLGPLLEGGISRETLEVPPTYWEQKLTHPPTRKHACIHPPHTRTYATHLQDNSSPRWRLTRPPRSHSRQWSSGWPWSTIGRWDLWGNICKMRGN